MKRAVPYKVATLAGALVAGVLFVLSACSDQGEGERCELLNDSDDCASNLICTPAAALNGSPSDRCCPVDRSRAENPICKLPVNLVGDAQAPAETGPPPTVTDGGASDASDASDAADADGG